ncbi:MAG: tetratricopeptide repeat protein [Apibacter sp.]|nr:tetratricopeptide repeat protein [Apibacter sp.]
MKILNLYICIFILLFFSFCKKINPQENIPSENRIELLGIWEGKEYTDNTFSINFRKIKGDSIFGQYCAVARGGRKIDCDTDEIFNIKGVIKGNTIEAVFNSFFDAKNGKAKIIVTDGSLKWIITKKPVGECYAPKESILIKSNNTTKNVNFNSFYASLPDLKAPINTKNLQLLTGKKCDDIFFNYDFDKNYFTIENLKVIGKFEVNNLKFIIYNFSLIGKGEGFEDDVYLINAFSENGNYFDNLVISGRLGGEGVSNTYSGKLTTNEIFIQIKEEYYDVSTGLDYTVSINKMRQYNFNFYTHKFEVLNEKYDCTNLNFNYFYEQVKMSFQQSNINVIVGDYSLKIKPYLYCTPLSAENVNKYNDIAYYLEQSGAYTESIFLLDIITRKYPTRAVTWLNLADAQWNIEEYQSAKRLYQKYCKLMKEQKKDLNKIPEYVYERMKE